MHKRMVAVVIAVIIAAVSFTGYASFAYGYHQGYNAGYSNGYDGGIYDTLVGTGTQISLPAGNYIAFSPPLYRSYTHISLSYSFGVVLPGGQNSSGTVQMIITTVGSNVIYNTSFVTKAQGHLSLNVSSTDGLSVMIKSNASNPIPVVVEWTGPMELALS